MLKMNELLKKIKNAMPRSNAEVSPVSIEIGSDWIKMAQRTRFKHGKGPTQVKGGLLKLASIKDSIGAAIEEKFSIEQWSKEQVIAFIPRHLITVRLLELPATDAKEIHDMIDLQVEKQTPYAKEEIIFAHKVVETVASGYSKVMLAIVARSIVQERLSALVSAGLSVRKFAISSEGVFQWFRETYPKALALKDPEALVLVEVDSNYSDFIIVRKGKIVFTRNILVGANHFSQEASEQHQRFSEELKRSMERYQTSEKHVEVKKVYLSGAGPAILGLRDVVASALGVPVESAGTKELPGGLNADDLRMVSMSPVLGGVSGDAELFLDLTPNEQKVQSQMQHKTRQLTWMGILTAAIVTALSCLSLLTFHAKSTYLKDLKETTARIALEAEGIDSLRGVIDLVEQRLDARGSSLDLITEIYRVTPREISLNDVDIEEKHAVVMRGNAFAMSDVFKYVKILEESEMLENVKTAYTRMKSDKDGEFAEFEIHGTYQKRE